MQRLTYDLGRHPALPAHSERQRQCSRQIRTKRRYINVSYLRRERDVEYIRQLEHLRVDCLKSASRIQIQYRNHDEKADEQRKIRIARPYEQ